MATPGAMALYGVMSCVAKHPGPMDLTRRSDRALTPVDVWLRREMKADFDSSLREPLPANWLDLLGSLPDRDER